MNCEQAKDLLTRYILGDLDASTRAAVTAHLETCGGCRALLRDIEPTLDLLRSALAVPTAVPRRLSETSRERIFRTAMPGPARKTLLWMVTRHRGLAAAAGLVLVVGVVWLIALRPGAPYRYTPLSQMGDVAHVVDQESAGIPEKRLEDVTTVPQGPEGQRDVLGLPAAPARRAAAEELGDGRFTNKQEEPGRASTVPASPDSASSEAAERLAPVAPAFDTRRNEPAVEAKKAVSDVQLGREFRKAQPADQLNREKEAVRTKRDTDTTAENGTAQATSSGKLGFLAGATAAGGEATRQVAADKTPAGDDSLFALRGIRMAAAADEKSRNASAPAAEPVPAQALKNVDREQGRPGEEDVPLGYRFRAYGVNPFIVAAKEPVSTFGIDVDTASYTITRNAMAHGFLPPAEAVRTEEFVNFFDYAYTPPDNRTFAIYTECAPSPFGRGLHLLKIGVKGRRLGREEERQAVLTFPIDSKDKANRVSTNNMSATLNTIATDVNIQVELNPQRVERYRQLGYENRQLKQEDFRNDAVHAGEVGSGQSVTALYELAIHSREQEPLSAAEKRRGRLPSDAVCVVRLRYRRMDTRAVEEIERIVRLSEILPRLDDASAAFRLAASAAEFAELLRGSPFSAGSDYQDVAAVLRPVALQLHLDNRVQELLRMVQTAGSLPRP